MIARSDTLQEPVDIFIAEDDAHDAFVLQQAAGRCGVAPSRMLVVHDGEQAARLFRAGHQLSLLRLCVFDLKLPRRSGLEVLRRVRRDPRWASVPVVILSGSDLPRDIEACYRAGASSYVIKHANYDENQCCIENMLRYWLFVNKLPVKAAYQSFGAICVAPGRLGARTRAVGRRGGRA